MALEKTLYSLIELQEIDLKLDKVQEERGDLPSVVENLKNTLETNNFLLEEQKESITRLKVESSSMETELGSLKEQLKKYEAQLYQVKTNKEYDAIANETENVKKKINELENNILEASEKIEELTKSNEEIESNIKQLTADYDDNNVALQDKISASSEEENLLKHERDIVQKKLTNQQINAYQRIRTAKKGMAVAYCNGGVCSGCFSFIPPQKVVEIRSMKKLFHCESCGRILVWDKNQE
jgi:predicted  nucleic acid-binding Zn-ribbon protein